MNYESSIEQKLHNGDYSNYTLHFQPVLNCNGSVRFIDHFQGKELTVGINVDDKAFGYRVQAEFPAIVADLVDLAVAIHASDRLAPHHLGGKPRRLQVVLPVRNPELLSTEPFRTKLGDLLEWATGSEWVFDFQKRVAPERVVEQQLSSRTQLITQNSGLQALSSKESAKNQCVINSVQLLSFANSTSRL